MHPRNRYAVPPSFAELAAEYPSLQPFIIGDGPHVTIDFKDVAAVRELTRCLLRRDFDVELALPPHALCPAITVRLNYLHWVEDLLGDGAADKDSIHSGIDMYVVKVCFLLLIPSSGTGTSCIYAMLACRLHPRWRMLAVDRDPQALHYAALNVASNSLTDRISVVSNASLGDQILSASLLDHATFDFTVCNPPFFSDAAEATQGADLKSLPPLSACTGNDAEMITAGGETAFVARMIADSRDIADRVKWFTSQVGIRAHVRPLLALARRSGASAIATGTFLQGKTTRWGVAWSFQDGVAAPQILAQAAADVLARKKKRKRPHDAVMRISGGVKEAHEKLMGVMVDKYGMRVQAEDPPATVVLEVKSVTWNRRARRAAAKRGGKEGEMGGKCGEKDGEMGGKSDNSGGKTEVSEAITAKTDEKASHFDTNTLESIASDALFIVEVQLEEEDIAEYEADNFGQDDHEPFTRAELLWAGGAPPNSQEIFSQFCNVLRREIAS